MKKIFLEAMAAILILGGGFRAMAWSAAGHMVVAAEAWRELSPELRAKTTEILKMHPEYARWERGFEPGNPELDLAEYIFMRASVWPDEIRRTEGDSAQYDHPHWHYINYPVKPPDFPMEPDSLPGDNAVSGIAACEKTLLNPQAPAQLRAVDLSYLIHVVGDVHQPLHCATLVDNAFPGGDKGGNDFYVKPGSKGIRLHSLWDGLLGRSYNFRDQLHDAIKLQAEYPRKSLPELERAKTAKDWSLESRLVAVNTAYRRGTLEGSRNEERAPRLAAGYTQAAKQAAERRGVLAGYRLADEMQKCLK